MPTFGNFFTCITYITWIQLKITSGKKKKKRERLFLQYSSIIIYMLWENKKHTVLLSSVKIDFMAAPGTAFMELNVLSHGTF